MNNPQSLLATKDAKAHEGLLKVFFAYLRALSG